MPIRRIHDHVTIELGGHIDCGTAWGAWYAFRLSNPVPAALHLTTSELSAALAAACIVSIDACSNIDQQLQNIAARKDSHSPVEVKAGRSMHEEEGRIGGTGSDDKTAWQRQVRFKSYKVSGWTARCGRRIEPRLGPRELGRKS